MRTTVNGALSEAAYYYERIDAYRSIPVRDAKPYFDKEKQIACAFVTLTAIQISRGKEGHSR
jgi:hypothetical protein